MEIHSNQAVSKKFPEMGFTKQKVWLGQHHFSGFIGLIPNSMKWNLRLHYDTGSSY